VKRLLLTCIYALSFIVISSCSHSGIEPDRTPQSIPLSALPPDWYSRFGACLQNPIESKFQIAWITYDNEVEKKIRANISALAEMPMPSEMTNFVNNLSKITPILTSMNAIKTSVWARKLFTNPTFVTLAQSSAFVYTLENPNFISMNQDPDFQKSYNGDPNFKNAFDTILSAMRDPSVQAAMTFFHRQGLVFVSEVGLASALGVADFLGLPENIDKLNSVQLLKDYPKPAAGRKLSGDFGVQFNEILKVSISDFLVQHPVTASRTITATVAEELNNLKSPDETIPYDDYVVKSHENDSNDNLTVDILGKSYNVGPKEITAIDGVARTLWGEARGCQIQGLHQFEAIALVIDNRAQAIQNTLDEDATDQEKNRQIDVQNMEVFMDANRQDYFTRFVSPKDRGISDFGRPGSSQLPASQVVSRPLQFSAWNGFTTRGMAISDFGIVPIGIPDVIFDLKVPEKPNDEAALINVLCPQISMNSNPARGLLGWDQKFPNSADGNWQEAVDLATLIVLDPVQFKDVYEFSPKPKSPTMFYTHGDNLRFVTREYFTGLSYKDPETGRSSILPLTAPRTGTCDELELFDARAGTVYGVSP
jgi:hypothetical protein